MQISTTPEGSRSSSASRLFRHSPRASGRLNDGMAMLNSGSTTFVRDNAASRLDPAAVGSRTAILSTIVRRDPSPARVVRASASRRWVGRSVRSAEHIARHRPRLERRHRIAGQPCPTGGPTEQPPGSLVSCPLSGSFDQCDTGFDDVERIDARRLGELGTQFDDELRHQRGGNSRSEAPMMTINLKSPMRPTTINIQPVSTAARRPIRARRTPITLETVRRRRPALPTAAKCRNAGGLSSPPSDLSGEARRGSSLATHGFCLKLSLPRRSATGLAFVSARVTHTGAFADTDDPAWAAGLARTTSVQTALPTVVVARIPVRGSASLGPRRAVSRRPCWRATGRSSISRCQP